MGEEASCQEEKGENTETQGTFEQDGRLRELCENAFQNQYCYKEESGTEIHKVPGTFWYLWSYM